jgi:hypothetical protein
MTIPQDKKICFLQAPQLPIISQMKNPTASVLISVSLTMSAFAQTPSEILALNTGTEWQRKNNAILLAPLTGCSPAEKSAEQAVAQTKILAEQTSILNSQLLIMQQQPK